MAVALVAVARSAQAGYGPYAAPGLYYGGGYASTYGGGYADTYSGGYGNAYTGGYANAYSGGGGGGGGGFHGNAITVLADDPYAVGSALTAVPLVLVPSNQLHVLHDARISAVSPTRPVVTLQAPEREATPAVRVVLARPMVVSSPETTIPFPATFTIVHQGLRMPIPVGAVLAPIHGGALVSPQRPYAIRVVYAVPTGPLPFSLPFHAQYPISRPLFINAAPVSSTSLGRPGFGAQRPGLARPPTPVRPAAPPSTPAPQPALPSRPQQEIPPRPPLVSSGRPVVTVLDFPSAVASPPVLVVQRPVFGAEDEQLGGGEPQAVVPAGIVQSTQPRPIQSVFSNSKDNEFLQQMRDQAAQNAEAGGGAAPLADYDKIVEVLYN